MSDPKMSPDPPRDRDRAFDWPDRPLVSGPLRISGTVLDGDGGWHVYRDALGWTTITLVGRAGSLVSGAGGAGSWRLAVDPILADAADASADPTTTAELLLGRLGGHAQGVEVGVLRVSPHKTLVEVLNVSLPALVHWDPIDGMSPHEPIARSLAQLPIGARSEVLRLRPGAAVLGATRGLLGASAGWGELRSFLSASAVDPFGADVAEAAPSELARMIRRTWRLRAGPSAMVVIGIPRLDRQVA